MTGDAFVLLALGWLVLSLLSLAVIACAGRAGHDEDVRRLARDPDLRAQPWAGARRAS